MKKIIFVMLSLYNGGAEKSLVNLLNELPKDRYHVDLFLFKKEGMFLSQVPTWVNILETPKELKELYAPVRKSNGMVLRKVGGTALSRILKKEGSERAAWRWETIYKKAIPELLDCYDVAIAYISGEVMYYVIDKINAKEKIVWIHNDHKAAKFPRDFDEVYLNQMESIVSISQKCVDILKEVFPNLSDKIYCVENITSSTVTRNRAKEFYPPEYIKDKPTILSIGRLTKQKGFDIAIDAAKLLKDRGVRFQWYVIGNGKLEKALKK